MLNQLLNTDFFQRCRNNYGGYILSSVKKVAVLLLLIVAIKKLQAQSSDPVSYVNPFIGTTASTAFTKWGNEGGTYPGAVAPSGSIQLTPETRVKGAKGYNYMDSSIYYFSCLQHQSGFPGGSSGKLLMMPVDGAEKFEAGIYRSKFLHRNEKAEPGYYSVLFDDGILSEATATERTGMFRFTFPKGMRPKIFIGGVGDISILSGQLIYGDKFHSVFNLSHAIAEEQKLPGGVVISFAYSATSVNTVTIRLSVSDIDFTNAQRNIDVESGRFDFDQLKQSTKLTWAKELSVVEIGDNNAINKTIFYTALYHSLLLPWIISDVDGNYLGADGKVHKVKGKKQYGGFSPWDTFRSLHPLLSLLYPGRQKDMIQSMLDIYEQSGFLPVESMTGNHAIPIIVDSWFKGINTFDSSLVYSAMKKSIVDPPFIQKDMPAYHAEGYIPFSFPESVTRTVEYAYDDWALANYSDKVMHQHNDYKYLLDGSYQYRKLLHVPDLFLLPRNNNEFKLEPGTSGYKEGDKWVYTYFVPQHAKDLINHLGGNKAFANRLDSALTNNLIVFDNETVFHIPYLFNYANSAGLTQRWVKNIMYHRFNASPGGIPGNDDLGSMSSWYVFSAMGIYPFSPGLPLYSIGSPLFNSITMHFANGKKFTIKSNNNSHDNVYVKSLTFNQKLYNKLTITHASLLQGGNMVFKMDSLPNNNWQTDRTDYSLSETIKDASFKMLSYDVSKKKVNPNEMLWVFFTIKNNGGTGTKIVNLFVDGKLYGSKNCLVPANAVTKDSISCRLYPYGKSVVKIESLKGEIVEVIPPVDSLSSALQVTGLLLKPIIKSNETQNISFTVQNTAGVERSFEIPILLDDSLLQGQYFLLGAGQTAFFSLPFTATKEGFHSVKINEVSANFKVYRFNKDAAVLDLDMKRNGLGNMMPDRSGFGNNGSIIRTKYMGDSSLTGDLLIGKDCFVEIPNSNSLDRMQESITMMAWVYPTAADSGLVDLFTKGDNHVLQLSGNRSLTFFAGGWGRGDCTVALPTNWLNNWHHIAGVCDGKSLQVYIDGVPGKRTLIDDSVNLSVINKWNLGRNEEFPVERIFNGYMKKVKVFVAPLSAEEITFEMRQK
jgi:putative alpha-1,2-mannosidase